MGGSGDGKQGKAVTMAWVDQVIGEAETLVTRGGKLKMYDGAGRAQWKGVVKVNNIRWK